MINAPTQPKSGLVSRLRLSVSSILKKVLAQCRPSATVSPKIVVLVTSLWLSLVLCELGLRLFMFQSFPDFKRVSRATLGYRYHRRYGWFPVPRAHTTFTFGARPISIVNNSKGLRDIEPVRDGRPGVLFLGDSFVWGYNVQAGERFTEKLRRRHPEWQVYNVGVVGYGTDQEYLLLQDCFRNYKPRLVFLIFCTENDFIDNCSNGGGSLYFKPYFTEQSDSLQQHGVPVPFSDKVFCSRCPLISKSYLARLAMRAWGNLRCPAPPFEREPTRALVRAMHDYVDKHGATFCVGLTRSDQSFERFLAGAKIPFLDLSTKLRVKGGWHWSPEGHTYVADKIDQFLSAQQFVPRLLASGR